MIPLSFLFSEKVGSWLVGKHASILFALSSVLLVAFTPVLWGYVKVPENPGLWENVGWGFLGVAGTLSTFFIWGGMWAYWTQCDSSRRSVKRIWFLVLLVGFCYGALLYYLLKYLPTVGFRHPIRDAEEK